MNFNNYTKKYLILKRFEILSIFIIILGIGLISNAYAVNPTTITAKMVSGQTSNPIDIQASNGTSYLKMDSNGKLITVKNHKFCLDASCVTYFISDGSNISINPGLAWSSISKSGSHLNDIGSPTSSYDFNGQQLNNVVISPIFTGNLTVSKSPLPNTEIDAGSGSSTPSYIIGIFGSTIYAKNGITGKIEFSGNNATTVIQSALSNISNGGEIHIKAGTYNVSSTLLPLRQSSQTTISGEGQFNTILQWVSNKKIPVIDAYDTSPTNRLILSMHDIQIRGGTSSSNQTTQAMTLGRTTFGIASIQYFDHIRFANCGVSPCVNMTFNQQATWSNIWFDNSKYVDLLVTNSSHLDIYGSQIENMRFVASQVNVFGGENHETSIDNLSNYAVAFFNTYFDGLDSGYHTHLLIGNNTLVKSFLCVACSFGNINNSTTDTMVQVGNGQDVQILNPRMASGIDPTIYYKVSSGATSTRLELPADKPISKVTDNGVNTQVKIGNIITPTSKNSGLNAGSMSGTPSTCVLGSIVYNNGNNALNVCTSTTPTWRPIVTTTQALTILANDVFSGTFNTTGTFTSIKPMNTTNDLTTSQVTKNQCVLEQYIGNGSAAWICHVGNIMKKVP